VIKIKDKQIDNHIMRVHRGNATDHCPFCRKWVYGYATEKPVEAVT